MSRNLAIKPLRTTRANLETQKSASGLLDGELYFITDDKMFAVGTGVNSYVDVRVKKRVYSTTSTATLTPEIASYDLFHLTAQAGALTIANHSTSTPTDGEQIKIRILDNGTARAITFGTNYVAKAGVALPTTTVLSKNMEMMFEWNANLSKWNLMAIGNE